MQETAGAIVVRRTPVPLMRQLRDQGRSDAELEQVAAAVALARDLFGSRIDFDGGPALNHFIGAGSVTAALGLPTELVAFAIVHNAYRGGDFADGRRSGADETRRAVVRDAVGETVELLVHERYADETDRLDGPLPDPDSREGRIQLTDLCELYEKYENGRIHAANPDRADRRAVEANGDAIVARARHLGGDDFADALAESFDRPPDIPVGAASGTTYGWQQIPSQTIVRPTIRARRAGARVTRPLREAVWWSRRQGRRVRRLVRRLRH
ncbi:MAG: hypothetical protein AAGA90_20710 [Actinomycetota bacterium]